MKNIIMEIVRGIVLVTVVVGIVIISRSDNLSIYAMTLFGVAPASINSNLSTTQLGKYQKDQRMAEKSRE
jgi:predicted permease